MALPVTLALNALPVTLVNPDGSAVGTVAIGTYLDGVTNKTLAAALSATPSGGTIFVMSGYAETLTADINIIKPVQIVLLGPATFTMGTKVIKTPTGLGYPGISGFSMRGPVRGSRDTLSQPQFVYTGTGTAIQIGAADVDTYGVDLDGFQVDILGAGSAAVGIDLIQTKYYHVGAAVKASTSTGTTQIGVRSNGNGSASNFNSYGRFDCSVFGANVGIKIDGPAHGNNANIFGVGCDVQPATDGTALYIVAGDSNESMGGDFHNAAIGIRFGVLATQNALSYARVEANTVDVQFDSGATFNGVMTGVKPTITDNSGVLTNWATQAFDRPAAVQDYKTAAGTTGNAQVNLQPNGQTAPAGLYRVSIYIEVTAVGSAGTITPQVITTDNAKLETFSGSAFTVTAVGAATFTQIVRSNGSTNLIAKANAAGLTGTPAYTMYASAERLA